MEDFPIWLKLSISVDHSASTVIYTVGALVYSNFVG